MVKYLCEVRKDKNELELIHAKHFKTNIPSQKGIVEFEDSDESDKYFRKYCVSEQALIDAYNNSNNFFMYLFWILLSIVIVCSLVQLCKGMNGNGMNGKMSPMTFGRFSF